MSDLHDFLSEAQVQQYHQKFVQILKVTTVAQLRDVEDADLSEIGMSRSEIAHMKFHLRKKFPHGAMGQLKKLFGKHREGRCERSQSLTERDLCPSGPSEKHVIPKSSVTLSHQLGTGHFGSDVWLGSWTKPDRTQVQVAVKCLPKAKLQKAVSDFLQEISILFSVSHQHLVPVFGVVLDIENIMLVMEHTPLQSLTECLKDASLRTSLSVRLLCDLAKQVVEAMLYLESHQIVHGNLCARNILVISVYHVKITDYGLSAAIGTDKCLPETKNEEELKTILPWCAPECFTSFHFTLSSDVWSFGVTLWEIFSYGTQPWSDLTCSEMLEAISPPSNHRLPKPKCCADEWYTEMQRCWQYKPQDRPRFTELYTTFSQIKLSRVVIQKDNTNPNAGCIQCKKGDTITILSKNPEKSPCAGFWLGVVDNTNEIGFLDPSSTTPHLEVIISDVNLQRPTKINRSRSLRASLRPSSQRLTASMISMPQNDMRHIGHVGFDGIVIGEVPFLGRSRNSSVGSGILDHGSHPSTTSLPVNGNSVSSPVKAVPLGNSVSSSSVFTNSREMGYPEQSQDFSDFKLPDLTSELNFGGSLYDEVMAALNQALSSRGVTTEDSSNEASKDCNAVTSDSAAVGDSRNSCPSDLEHVSCPDDATSGLHSEISEGQKRLARGQAEFTSSAYGVYSIQNAARNRNLVNDANHVATSDVHEHSANGSSLSERTGVASDIASPAPYMNVPKSAMYRKLTPSTTGQDTPPYTDNGLYLEPRKLGKHHV